MPWMAILGAVGSGVSAAGQVKQGQDTKKAFDYNADITDLNTAISEEQIRRQYGRVRGTQQALMSSSGLVSNTGSFLEVMADQAYEAEKDALLTRWKGATQSNLETMQGKNELTSGYMKAGGTLLSGASSFMKGVRR